MPQTVDRLDFVCTDIDPSQWPKLSCGENSQLVLQDSDLRLAVNRTILFEDNGQIRSFDDNHKLVFDRAGSLLELHEAGDIRFLTGAPALTEKLRIRADGNVGVGTNTPGAKLHVMGDIRVEGNLRVTGDVNLDVNLSVAGPVHLGGNTQVQGNLQVSGTIDALDVRQNGTQMVSSQWRNIAGGITFTDGRVSIGAMTLDEGLNVVGRIRASTLTVGAWPANSAYVFLGTNALNQGRAGNYALLQGASGTDLGRTFLNSPQQIHFRINNGDRMFLANNGNVGIGTTNPGVKLHIMGGTDAETTTPSGYLVLGALSQANIAMDDNEILARNNGQKSTLFFQANGGDIWVHSKQNGTDFIIKDNGFVGIGTSNPRAFVEVRGGATCNGSRWIDFSSIVNKKNVAALSLDEAMATLAGLNAVTFTYKDMPIEKRCVGFIAEDVPHLVASPDRKGLSAMDIVGILTKVVQHQQQEITALKAER